MAEQRQSAPFLALALLDSADRLVAVNADWQRLTEGVNVGDSLQHLERAVPALAVSLRGELADSSNRETNLDGIRYRVQIIGLPGMEAVAHRLLIVEAALAGIRGEEDARKLRHDIKNRIGGLKLYATFLKRKLIDQPELLEVVTKMITSLDQMTDEVNKIRY